MKIFFFHFFISYFGGVYGDEMQVLRGLREPWFGVSEGNSVFGDYFLLLLNVIDRMFISDVNELPAKNTI